MTILSSDPKDENANYMVIILDSETRSQDPLGSRWKWANVILTINDHLFQCVACLLVDLYSNDDNGGDNDDNADNDAYEDKYLCDFELL